jgi:ABC-2 type transport system ATP-binding protein
MSARSEPEGSSVALAVKDVSKSYGPIKALDGLSLGVARSEFVALLGPNGAGKSTLFQLLTGLFVPDAGEIEVAGFDMRHHARQALARLGVVFQQATLDLDLSVAANLRFHARLHGMGRATRPRIDAELQRIGLTARAKDRARTLSGGNRRKVELARALLHEPVVLLMDEPTVGLDPASRTQLVEYVHSLCTHRGVGVLWATHLVDEAESADRVIILHKGRWIASGTPAALREQTGCHSLRDAFLELTGEAPAEKEETV